MNEVDERYIEAEAVEVLMALRVKAVREEGETDGELLARLRSFSEWEDWDVLEAEVKS